MIRYLRNILSDVAFRLGDILEAPINEPIIRVNEAPLYEDLRDRVERLERALPGVAEGLLDLCEWKPKVQRGDTFENIYRLLDSLNDPQQK